eukprot:1901186-Pleurochrysis_carterae.AAC.1
MLNAAVLRRFVIRPHASLEELLIWRSIGISIEQGHEQSRILAGTGHANQFHTIGIYAANSSESFADEQRINQLPKKF